MRITSSFSSGRVAGAIREHFDSLLSVEVRRVHGTERIPVETIEFEAAEAETSRPVEAGEHPSETVREIDKAIAKLAQQHANEHGSGTYEVELSFAKPPRGTRRQPVIVQWDVTAKERAFDAERAKVEFFLAALKEYHASHLQTLSMAHQMLGSMGKLWGDVAQTAATLNERALKESSTSAELEALRVEKESGDRRWAFALQTIGPALSRVGVSPQVLASVAEQPAIGPSRGELGPSLVPRAHAWARSITADQRLALHPDILAAIAAIEHARDLASLQLALLTHKDRVIGRFDQLEDVLSPGQKTELEAIVMTLSAAVPNHAAAE